MYINNDLSREFYLEMCRLEKWTTRTLNEKFDSMLFERTAISIKPDNQIQKEIKALRDENKLSLDLVFRDPYIRFFRIR